MKFADGHPVGGVRARPVLAQVGGQILGTLTPTPGVPPANTVRSPVAASYTWMWTNDRVIPVDRARV